MNISGSQVARVALPVAFLLCLFGCIDRRDRLDDNLQSGAEITPLTKEFVLVAQRSYYYRSIATSFRYESDQPRDGRVMHVENELQCPDRFHLRITGAVELERIVIGTTQYERRNRGPWTKTTEPSSLMSWNRCRFVEENKRKPVPDEAQAELLAPVYGAIQVAKGSEREYHGTKCTEYTITGPQRPSVTDCFSVGTETHLIRTTGGDWSSTSYDFNKPIRIDAPDMNAAPPQAR